MRGLSGHPSGPLSSVDALEAGRTDTRRLLRPSSLAASDHRCLLTDPLAVAMAARGTAGLLARSRHDRSTQRPSRAYEVATAWPSPSPWSAQAAARAGGGWHGANRNGSI